LNNKTEQSIKFILSNVSNYVDQDNLIRLLDILNDTDRICFVCNLTPLPSIDKLKYPYQDNYLSSLINNIQELLFQDDKENVLFYPLQLYKTKKNIGDSELEFKSNCLINLTKEIEYFWINYFSLNTRLNFITVGNSIDSFILTEMLENIGLKLNIINIKKDDSMNMITDLIKRKLNI